MMQMMDLAKSIFLRNALHYCEPDRAEAIWMLEEDVRAFWVTEALAIMNDLGVDPG